MPIQYLNPEGMLHSPAFSQAIAVDPGMRLLFIGGQNGVDSDGKVVAEDLAGQTRQILGNMRRTTEAAGGKLEDIIKWTIFIVEGQDSRAGFGVFLEEWDRNAPPPVITAAFVAGLGVPGALVEIEAVAAIPA
jgi:enamine deaminase RidA (YjgF/YER057c/UK114 family)